eukprot:TRINITY_DN1879_c0_g1_i1.p1 TRINITY_DN1879_c0_g1~~TRINITY_DN1879_c0_g1_i1.p1  ORF type:complete len:881 (+),score=298.57 TRINITY_DN1879_c0_g1_i1:249-2891(+)
MQHQRPPPPDADGGADNQHAVAAVEPHGDEDDMAHTIGGDDYQMEGGVEDEEYEPSEQEIAEYCEWLGMDPLQDRALMWIAREALKAPLPEHWKICYTDDREVYYFNMRTGESIWDHPMDAYYKALFRQEKGKLEKKRRKMRLYSGSMTIQPLQDFFSDLGGPASPGAPARLWHDLPDALCDPIDFKLFIDPVVLPSSGRTVSKHTIVNNKWRDPFCREYIENRRLIGNVDKRNEVGVWLEAATADYFQDVSFSPDVTAWSKQPDPIASHCPESQPPGGCTPFSELRKRMQHLLRIMPFLLDKEEEVCLNAQGRALDFIRVCCRLPARPPPPAVPSPSVASVSSRQTPSRGCRRPSRTSDAAADESPIRTPQQHKEKRGRQPAEPRPPTEDTAASASVLQDLVTSTGDPAVLLSCLLTMSTSSSIEALYLVLRHCPQLRSHPVLRGYSAEVLNVLQLAPGDLGLVSQSLLRHHSGTGGSLCDLRTSNTDFWVKLGWCLLVGASTSGKNVLASLEWSVALPLVVCASNSLTLDQQQQNALCRTLRGLHGWPGSIKECEPDTIRWMVGVALADACPQSKILLLYDLLVNGSDSAFSVVRRQRSAVLAALFDAASPQPQDLTYGSMLGALLVFNDVCRLDDLQQKPRLQLHVAHDLLPRLTRLQWRPRLFEQTLNTICGVVKANPALAWDILGAERVDFLLRELSKKKKNSDDLRLKLESIQASEKRLAQSNAINNWLLLSSASGLRTAQRDRRSSTALARAVRRREEIRCERVANLLVILNTLLTVRLKPKPSRAREDRGEAGCREPILKAGPPTAARRPATPSGGREGGPRRREAAHVKDAVLTTREMPPLPSSAAVPHRPADADCGAMTASAGTVTLPPI